MANDPQWQDYESNYKPATYGSHARGSHAASGSRRSASTRSPLGAQQYSARNDYGFAPIPDASNTNEYIRVRKKRKKSGWKRAVLGVVIALACVCAFAGGAAALYLNSLQQSMQIDNTEEQEKLKDALVPADTSSAGKQSPFYTLILGSDAREGDTASRSDVIILMRVDPADNKVTLVSIPRDTMVTIEGHGTSKINAAYAYDGAAGAVKAVSKLTHVSISHYVEVDFEGLETVVDDLGGVMVNVPVSNDETGASNTGVTLEAGEHLLTGEQALALARERYGYTRGDFQRADNQRLVAEAIMKKVLDLPVAELPGAVSSLAGCVSTDLSVSDIISFAQMYQQAEGSLTVYSAMVPSSTSTIDGVSYVITDTTSWTKMMELVDAGEDPNAYSTQSTTSDASEATSSGDQAGGSSG